MAEAPAISNKCSIEHTSHLRVVRKLVGISFGRRHVLRILSCPLAPVPVDLELGHSGFGCDLVLRMSIATLVEDSRFGSPWVGGQYVPLELFPKGRRWGSLPQLRLRVVDVHIIANPDELRGLSQNRMRKIESPADLYEQVRRTTVTPTRSASGILSGLGGSAWTKSKYKS